MKSSLSLPGNQWLVRYAGIPGSEGVFRWRASCWRFGLSHLLYSYKPVKYKCYAIGIYFQMALLRQRTAQGSNAAEIEKKIKR